MIDLLLFSLPTWVVALGVALYLPASFLLALLIGRVLAWNDDRLFTRDEEHDLALAEDARLDTQRRRLEALDGMGQEIETGNVVWLFPERARRRGLAERVMDSDGIGAA